MQLTVPLDAIDGCLVALHLDEGKAVLRVAVAFDDQGTDFPVLLEVTGQFGLQIPEVSLPAGPRTLPSRLVMNSLVGVVAGEPDRPLFDDLDELRELMINLIQKIFNTRTHTPSLPEPGGTRLKQGRCSPTGLDCKARGNPRIYKIIVFLLRTMSSRIVTLPMENDYPFSLSTEHGLPRTTVQVRKTIELHMEPRYIMREKIRLLKAMAEPRLVALLATNQQQKSLVLTFQYVHTKFDSELWVQDVEVIDRIKAQLLELALSLTRHCVLHEFRFENVGVGTDGDLKYFIGFNFKVDKGADQGELTAQYRRCIGAMFGEGRFRRASSPYRHSKKQYNQTMDTTLKINGQLDSNWQAGVQLNMKKSATILEKPSESITEEYYHTKLNSKYSEKTTNALKLVKIDNIGTRIHQLKASVKRLAGQTPGGQTSKGLAGQTPKNSSGNLHLTIKVQNQSNLQGKPELKQGLASPNFLQLEKKIAQWRESNLCKSSEREGLVSARDKGKQLSNSGNFTKTESAEVLQGSQFLKLIPPSPKSMIIPKSPSVKKIPSYLFKKDKPTGGKQERSKQSFNQSKSKGLNQSKSKAAPNVNSSNHNSNNPCEISYQNHYRHMASTDKYCQEFMHFLDDEPVSQLEGEMSPLTELITQIGSENQIQLERGMPPPRQQKEGASEIKVRVNKAIRNSLKIIKGLKYRESSGV